MSLVILVSGLCYPQKNSSWVLGLFSFVIVLMFLCVCVFDRQHGGTGRGISQQQLGWVRLEFRSVQFCPLGQRPRHLSVSCCLPGRMSRELDGLSSHSQTAHCGMQAPQVSALPAALQLQLQYIFKYFKIERNFFSEYLLVGFCIGLDTYTFCYFMFVY